MAKPPEKPAPGVTPEQAAKILQGNIYNVARKVHEGKTLSAQEVAVLQAVANHRDPAAPSAGSFVRNQVELAEVLGVNRKTVQRWLRVKGHPGTASDGRYNVMEWREWARTIGHRFADENLDKQRLEAERILIQNRLLELKLKEKEGSVTANADLEVWIAQMVNAAKTVLLAMPGILAPEVVGLTAPAAEKRIRDCINDALEKLNSQPWKT